MVISLEHFGIDNMNEVYKLPSEIKQEKITEIIKAAIKKLNKIKGTNLKLYKISFGLGVDTKYGSGQLDTAISLTVQDTVSKKINKFFWYESFFNPDLPDNKDADSGANKVSNPKDKVVIRTAYSIWFCRHWMYQPQKKNKK